MRVTKAAFVTSLAELKRFPGRGRPEIAMAGRSNVGKSSLINSLCNNSRLARTSSEPGKTRLINLYAINEQFFLVDLPGYGFAKTGGDERRRWKGMIEGYLENSEFLRHVLLLVDLRHEPSEEDAQMAAYLRAIGADFSVVATKADKLSKAQQSKNIPVICRKLIVQPWQIITYSAQTHQGRDKVLSLLDGILNPQKPPADDGIVLPEDLRFDDGPTREQP
ncbi:MAG: YihA family ribosome biogenesis GTP-binding protein [Clostridia bacterium]|nr:YihA family ribosome biogenesis GTP-binding protein [Clostridia bacterium]